MSPENTAFQAEQIAQGQYHQNSGRRPCLAWKIKAKFIFDQNCPDKYFSIQFILIMQNRPKRVIALRAMVTQSSQAGGTPFLLGESWDCRMFYQSGCGKWERWIKSVVLLAELLTLWRGREVGAERDLRETHWFIVTQAYITWPVNAQVEREDRLLRL
jgi:hypothetical protein